MQGSVPWRQCSFVDREMELQALDEAYRSRPGLLVLYGRRCIGKTRLLSEWSRRRGLHVVYYIAHLSSHGHNLKLLAERAAEQLGDPLLSRIAPSNLGDLLTMIARDGAEVVVIDEFTYWARSAPRVLSELQSFVDEDLQNTNMLLVISGSLIGVMERTVLGGGSPLYARARWRLRLGELEFYHIKSFVPKMSSVDRVRLYALVGGIPFYLCLASGFSDIREVVRNLILAPGAPLRYEKDLLLREELREPHTYSAVLSAIARGYETPARIASATGIDQSHTHKYLSVLEHLGFVERATPLFKRKGRYRVRDPVLRVWYTLIEPVLELLELGRIEEAEREIISSLDPYTAPVWEELIRKYLLRKYAPRGYTLSGHLEHKGEELDVAIINKSQKKAIVAEAKWATLTVREAERLRAQAFARAQRLLPKGYMVEDAYVAAKHVEGSRDEYWVITPQTMESNP